MTGARTITEALGGRWCGSYGIVRCPAHDDREPSLKIKDDARNSDGIDVHCFSGCSWQDVKVELQRQVPGAGPPPAVRPAYPHRRNWSHAEL
jgi:hypothetical protein